MTIRRKKILKPAAEGALVPNPSTGHSLSPDGEAVTMTSYWVRRLRAGEVVELEKESSKKTAADIGEKIRKILNGMDASVDNQWTSSGAPAMAYIEAELEDTSIKRADVDAAAPGFNRKSASEGAE